MADFLDEMAASSRARIELARVDADRTRDRAALGSAPRELDLRPDSFALIAEVKLRAPSVGQLAAPLDPVAAAVAQALAYAEAGALAISVLTEPSRFDGQLEHLAAVAAAVDVPVMRKDFLLDPIQLYEARAAGASGALLITRMLDDRVLDVMLSVASELGLFVLIESFDEVDLRRTAAALLRHPNAPTALAGVNTRDLATLQVDGGRLERLASLMPPGVAAVAESGILTPADARRAAELGYPVALVGSALMKAADPGQAAAALLEAGQQGLDGRS